MGIYDRLFSVAGEAVARLPSPDETAKSMAAARETERRLISAWTTFVRANSPEAKMRAVVDLLMAGQEHENAAKAVGNVFTSAHKTFAAGMKRLEAEMVPFAAEQNIAGSTHYAEYQSGSDRVVVTDYAKARRSAPDEFWRFKDPEPDKVKLAAAMRSGRKFEGIGWDEGPPSLRIKKIEMKKDGDHE